MAPYGMISTPSLENIEVAYFSQNLLTRLSRPSPSQFIGKNISSDYKKFCGVRSSMSRKAVSSVEAHDNSQSNFSILLEEESEHVITFKTSDFKILDRVSIGFGGRV